MTKYVQATPYNGVDQPLSQHMQQLEITDDLPADVIGECVALATEKAWKAGFDPAKPPFFVAVHFR